MKINFTKNTYTIFAAAIAALVGMIIYIITSVTGYLAASAMNPWPVLCTVLSLLMLAAVVFMENKMTPVIKDALLILASVMLLVSLYFFVLGRVQLAADVYFIPVNYPASEASALHISIAGVVFYLIADIAMIVAGFSGEKKQEA